MNNCHFSRFVTFDLGVTVEVKNHAISTGPNLYLPGETSRKTKGNLSSRF